MHKFWTSIEFIEQQKFWYKKVEASNENAEIIVRDESFVLSEHIAERGSQSYRSEKIAEKSAYYRAIAKGMSQLVIENEADKIIMEMHSEGKTMRTISQVLKECGLKCHVQTIRYVIRSFENLWGIRSWKPYQLRSKKMPKKKPPIQS